MMKPLLVLLFAAAPTLLLAANAPVPAQLPSNSKIRSPEVPAAVPGAQKNQEPGKVDAPVDGLDGKPHDGPGLFETKEKGSGDVGISGGKSLVDLQKPPPHTGEHEIVNVEDVEDEDKSLVCSLYFSTAYLFVVR
jgi:hypothetical protein